MWALYGSPINILYFSDTSLLGIGAKGGPRDEWPLTLSRELKGGPAPVKCEGYWGCLHGSLGCRGSKYEAGCIGWL